MLTYIVNRIDVTDVTDLQCNELDHIDTWVLYIWNSIACLASVEAYSKK